ncbi:MAG: peptidylprolyl isomerase [Myxococcota bacterium]
MRLVQSIVGALLLVGLTAGCDGDGASSNNTTENKPPSEAAPAEDIGDVIAEVNGAAIGSEAFKQAAARKPAEGDTLSDEERTEIVDSLIAEELLYQEALRKGLDRDPKVKKVMVNTLLRQEVFGAVRNSDFTDEELEAYYNAHKEEFVVPEKVQIKRILIEISDKLPEAEAKAKAESIRGQIVAQPNRFKELATENSDDPYRRRGGDVGFVPRSGKPGLDQAIVDKAFEMEVDQISEVFQADGGFNIIMVANKRDRVERTFQQMKGSVLRKVKSEKLEEMYDQYTANLRTGATVSVEEETVSAIEVKPNRQIGPSGLPGLRRDLRRGGPGQDGAGNADGGEE